MDSIVHRVARSQTRLIADFHFHTSAGEDVHREPWNHGGGKLSVTGKGGGTACTILRVVLVVFSACFLWKWKSLSRVWLFATPWTRQILQGIFPTQGLNPGLQHCRHSWPAEPQGREALYFINKPSARKSSVLPVTFYTLHPFNWQSPVLTMPTCCLLLSPGCQQTSRNHAEAWDGGAATLTHSKIPNSAGKNLPAMQETSVQP